MLMRMGWRSASESCWSLWLSSSGLKSWSYNAIRIYVWRSRRFFSEIFQVFMMRWRYSGANVLVCRGFRWSQWSASRYIAKESKRFWWANNFGRSNNGVDGQSRTSDDLPKRPLQVHGDKKVAKYGQIAEENTLRFVPAVSSLQAHFYELTTQEATLSLALLYNTRKTTKEIQNNSGASAGD